MLARADELSRWFQYSAGVVFRTQMCRLSLALNLLMSVLFQLYSWSLLKFCLWTKTQSHISVFCFVLSVATTYLSLFRFYVNFLNFLSILYLYPFVLCSSAKRTDLTMLYFCFLHRLSDSTFCAIKLRGSAFIELIYSIYPNSPINLGK